MLLYSNKISINQLEFIYYQMVSYAIIDFTKHFYIYIGNIRNII